MSETGTVPFLGLQEQDGKSAAVESQLRKRNVLIWSLGFLSAALAVVVVVLAVRYAQLKDSSSSSSPNQQSKSALPARFSASNVLKTSATGSQANIVMYYDGVANQETQVYYRTSGVPVALRADYGLGAAEIKDDSSTGVCQFFPTAKTMPRFDYVSTIPAGTDTVYGDVCTRHRAVRADGESFFFSVNGAGQTCSVEFNGIKLAFDLTQFTTGAVPPQMIGLTCLPQSDDLAMIAMGGKVRPLSIWSDIGNWWDSVRCSGCEHVLNWAIDNIADGVGDGICAETGPFAAACGYVFDSAAEGLCSYFDCAQRGCSLIHLC